MRVIHGLAGTTACAFVLTACNDPAFHCTPDAAVWRVTVVDTNGAPVTDLRWTSVIVSTQDTISPTTLAANSYPSTGEYAVFVDDPQHPIDPAGDVVQVEMEHARNG